MNFFVIFNLNINLVYVNVII